ncbi:MAG: hypothetical protein FJ398_26565 [Verrucomicrobia bacterium]|nr:hypothetical protein [Verrucomicrobiota bacterium]
MEQLWDLTSAEPNVHKSLKHDSLVTEIALSFDNRYLATASVDHFVRVWAIESGAAVATFKAGRSSPGAYQ